MDKPRWGADRLNIAILAVERRTTRKVGWITTGPGGILFGIARGTGSGANYSYHADGRFYRVSATQTPGGPRENSELMEKHPPLHEIKGLQRLLSAEIGHGDRLRGFPFRKSHESIRVKGAEGRVAFNVGLLEPNSPQALGGFERGQKVHFRLVTRTKPWIVIWNRAGFEAPLNVHR